jgi:membrane-associated protein
MFNASHIIESGGLLVIAIMIFAESGMLLGFIFPGDTLLFTAGFFAGQGRLPLIGLIITVIIAAILGDNIGYQIGKTAGKKLFRKEDGVLFRQSYVVKAESFYEKHGGKTILFASFFPVIRTFVPMVAGIGHMDRKKFVIYNVFGVIAWGGGVVLLGDWLGHKIPNIDKYLIPAMGLAVLISFGPMLFHIVQGIINRHTTPKSGAKEK